MLCAIFLNKNLHIHSWIFGLHERQQSLFDEKTKQKDTQSNYYMLSIISVVASSSKNVHHKLLVKYVLS